MTTRPPTLTARCAACAVLAVAFFAASLGLPFPAASRLSCQDRACGCSAERVANGTCCCAGLVVKSCCSLKAAGCCEDESPRVRWNLAWESARCRGLGPGGLLVPPPGLPPVVPVAVVRWSDPGDAVAPRCDRAVCVPSPPPTPPPKLV
jgi:hypothetical protein